MEKNFKYSWSIFENLAVDYDKWFEFEGKGIYENEITAFKSISEEITNPSLEIGVGSGRFAMPLHVDFGIDPSINLLAISKKRGIKVVQGIGEDLPFKDRSFKTVLIVVTICFVRSPVKLLKETKRVLEPGGDAILGLVLRDSPWGRLYEKKKNEGHRFYKYARFYTFEQIKAMLGSTGFKIGNVVSTLFSSPTGKIERETPQFGYSKDAGFTIIDAKFTMT